MLSEKQHVKIQIEYNMYLWRGDRFEYPSYDVFQSLKVFILSNSADPDEMQNSATFHQGLHYLQKYLLRQVIYVITTYM